MDTSQYLVIFFQILGSLALLIYGMKVMSEALQKMAGSQLRHILGAMTPTDLRECLQVPLLPVPFRVPLQLPL